MTEIEASQGAVSSVVTNPLLALALRTDLVGFCQPLLKYLISYGYVKSKRFTRMAPSMYIKLATNYGCTRLKQPRTT